MLRAWVLRGALCWLIRTGDAGYRRRALAYRRLDARLAERTRFFGAASFICESLAVLSSAVGSLAAGGATRRFLASLSADLHAFNLHLAFCLEAEGSRAGPLAAEGERRADCSAGGKGAAAAVYRAHGKGATDLVEGARGKDAADPVDSARSKDVVDPFDCLMVRIEQARVQALLDEERRRDPDRHRRLTRRIDCLMRLAARAPAQFKALNELGRIVCEVQTRIGRAPVFACRSDREAIGFGIVGRLPRKREAGTVPAEP